MVRSRIGSRRASLAAVVAAFACALVAPAGALGAVGDLTFDGCIGNLSGCAPTISANALSGADSVAVSADGKSVYVGSEGSLDVLSREPSGALVDKGCIGEKEGCTKEAAMPKGAVVGIRSVAVSPEGSDVYLAASSAGVVDVFSRESSGALTYKSCIGNSEGCAATSAPEALDKANSVAASADASSVYATGAGTINQFSRALGTPSNVTCENITQNITFLFPTKITLKCSDTNGEPLSYAIVGEPTHGKLGPIGPTGTVSYMSSTLIPVSDSFTYMASDAQGSSNIATVTLTFHLSTKGFSTGTGLTGQPGGSGGLTHGAGSLTATPQTTRATFDNQRITLTTPSLETCTRKSEKLAAALKSTAIAGSKAPKLRFASAAFYIDKGIKHTRRKTIRTPSGHRKTVTVATYTANATARHVPSTLALSLTGLKSGTHKLTVKVSYKETTRKHGHKITVSVSKTLTTQFKVC